VLSGFQGLASAFVIGLAANAAENDGVPATTN
jgi:hypothetical protein